MKNNENFRQDLIVSYLSDLVKQENAQEFDKYYASVESYIVSLASKSEDLEVLGKINAILAFRKKNMRQLG